MCPFDKPHVQTGGLNRHHATHLEVRMDVRAKNTMAESWRQRVAAQQASGQSIRVWCREHGCHEHAFYWWRAKLGLSPVTTRKPRRRVAGVTPVGFARIVVKAGQLRDRMNPADAIRVSLLGGREVTVPLSMPVEDIGKLLRAIEGAA
jgi:hypothetical protein